MPVGVVLVGPRHVLLRHGVRALVEGEALLQVALVVLRAVRLLPLVREEVAAWSGVAQILAGAGVGQKRVVLHRARVPAGGWEAARVGVDDDGRGVAAVVRPSAVVHPRQQARAVRRRLLGAGALLGARVADPPRVVAGPHAVAGHRVVVRAADVGRLEEALVRVRPVRVVDQLVFVREEVAVRVRRAELLALLLARQERVLRHLVG